MKKPPSLTAWSAAAWAILLPFLPPPAPRGRPRTQGWRGLLEARFSVVRRGGAGRLLPHALPPRQTVEHSFRQWRRAGIGEQLHPAWRARPRGQLGRAPQPRAGGGDRQAVKTTSVGGGRGYDGGKQVKGRQRPRWVDPPGFVRHAVGPSAGSMDGAGLRFLREPVQGRFPCRQQGGLDAAYKGQGTGKHWGEATLGWTAEGGTASPAPAECQCLRRRGRSLGGGFATARLSRPPAPGGGGADRWLD